MISSCKTFNSSNMLCEESKVFVTAVYQRKSCGWTETVRLESLVERFFFIKKPRESNSCTEDDAHYLYKNILQFPSHFLLFSEGRLDSHDDREGAKGKQENAELLCPLKSPATVQALEANISLAKSDLTVMEASTFLVEDCNIDQLGRKLLKPFRRQMFHYLFLLDSFESLNIRKETSFSQSCSIPTPAPNALPDPALPIYFRKRRKATLEQSYALITPFLRDHGMDPSNAITKKFQVKFIES